MSALERVDRVLAAICVIAVAAVVLVVIAGPSLIGAKKETAAATAAKSDAASAAPAAVDGKAIFSDNCSSCHTLAAAGASGNIGPNLDDADPSVETVSSTVTEGSGPMPSFGGDLSEQEIAAVADFVASSAQ